MSKNNGYGSEAEQAKDEKSETESEESIEASDNDGDGAESEEQESDEENAMDDLSDLMPAVLRGGEEPELAKAKKEKTSEHRQQKSGPQATPGSEPDLPFVMDVPKSAEALAALLLGQPVRHWEVVFSRILKTNHPSLNPANKSKMLAFCEHILEVIKSGDVSWSESVALGGEWALLSRWNAADCLTRLADSVLDDADSDAKRTCAIYPEAISCLASCLKTATKPSSPTAPSNVSRHKIEDDVRILLTNLQGDEQQPSNEQILYLSSVLLADFINVYRIYPQSKILFKSVSESISLIKADDFPKRLKEAVSELRRALAALEAAQLPALARAAQRPKALRQYEPSFGIVREGDRGSRRLPADALAHQKLVRRHRHETKGALRELRRDRRFLASVKLRQTSQSDEQRMKKVKEIFGSAASQQGELRKLKRKK